MAKRSSSPADSQQSKETLELKRLELEVQALRHPIRTSLKSFNWKDCVAIAVALAGISLAVVTGLFNVRHERLAVTTERLRIERMHLEQGNKELEETRSLLTLEQEQLVTELQKTKGQLVSYEKEWEAIEILASGFGQALATKLTLQDGARSFGFEIEPGSGFGTREYLGGDAEPKENPRIPGVLETLQDVPRLSSLRINDIVLSEEDVRRIATLKITRLSLSNNQLSDKMVEPLGHVSQLAHLSLEGNKEIRHPQALGKLHNLTFLHLERTSYDDEGMVQLKPLSNRLQFLFLQATEVSDAGLSYLRNFTALKNLDLTSCRNVTGTGLVELVTLPSLKWLRIDRCGIPDDGHISFVESLRKQNPDLVIDDYFGQPEMPAPKFGQGLLPPPKE